MSDALTRVIAAKRDLLATRMAETSLAELDRRATEADPPRGFARALARHAAHGYGLIAEIKRASPSGGPIRPDLSPADIARAYEAGGAACLSVLTDTPFFHGQDADLIEARAAVELPVLRKDFLVDPYQVVESRALGADCILLILACLDDSLALDLKEAAEDYGMDVLVEVHDRTELDRALALEPLLVGINNRNLKTLKTDLETSLDLAPTLPLGTIGVAESGLKTPADLRRMAEAGLRCFLVGESLLRQPDIEAATRELLG